MLKSILGALFLFLGCTVFNSCVAYPPLVLEGKIAPDFQSLAEFLYGKEGLPRDARNLKAWNDWAQTHFLRPRNKDHMDIKDHPKDPRHNKLMKYFDNLGLINAVTPSKSQYQAIVIFGGGPWNSRERMNYVQKLWEDGVRAEHIVYIGGHRKLSEKETLAHVLNEVKPYIPNRSGWVAPQKVELYENQAAKVVWDQIIVDDTLRSKLKILTTHPKHDAVTGNFIRRANTEDTIIDFFKKYPKIKDVLFVSSAPYGPYQNETVIKVLKEMKLHHVTAETVSDDLHMDATTLAFLDTLARRLYTIYQYSKQRSQK